MATVARLNVQIGADIKSFQQGMAKLENQLKQVGSNLRNTGRQLSTAVTLPILGIGAAAVKAASDAEEMQSKFNTVFRTVGGDVTKQLDAFARASGRSRYELMGMAAQLGDIFKPLGYTEEQAGNLSVQVSKLAVDLGSFNNMPMDEALARLRGTLVGSHENALAFGVVINEASIKQELMRMGADKLTGAQLNQAKVQARLNLLMEGTVDAQGDAIRTSGSFANRLIKLQNAAKDLGVTLGELIIPYAKELVATLQGMVDYVSNLSPETKKTAIAFVGMAAALGPILFILGGVAASFSAIFSAMTLVAGLINPWTLAFAALAAIGIAIYRNWDAVKQAFVGTWTAIKDLITNLKNNFINTWVGIFKSAELALKGDFEGAWTTLKETTATGAASVVTELSTFGTDIGAAVAPAAAALMFDPFALGDPFKKFKDSAKANLETDDDSVITSADAAKTALADIIAEVGNVEALNPSFTLIETALYGTELSASDLKGAFDDITAAVNSTDILAPAFATIKSALLGAEVNADDLEAAFTAIETAVDSADLLTPSFALLKTGLSGAKLSADSVDTAIANISTEVNDIEALAPSFATLRKALGSTAAGDVSIANAGSAASLGVKGIGDEVVAIEAITPDFSTIIDALSGKDGSVAAAAGVAMDALKPPETLEDYPIPNIDQTTLTRWQEFKAIASVLGGYLGTAKDNSYNLSRYTRDVSAALDTLGFGDDKPIGKFFKALGTGATDVYTVLLGLQGIKGMVDLIQPLFTKKWWSDFYDDMKDVAGFIGDVIRGIGNLVSGGGGGGGVTIGGTPGTNVPPVTIPGSGGGATTTAAGGGVVAGVLTGLTTAGIGAIIGANINAIIQARGVQEPWTRMGITREEWIQQQIQSGAYAQFLGNLMGPGSDLSWLSGASGGIGGLFGGSQSWLSGLQGYMGTGGSANTSGVMGSMGMTTGGQTINVNLDGQTIATATMPYWSQELEIYGTNR